MSEPTRPKTIGAGRMAKTESTVSLTGLADLAQAHPARAMEAGKAHLDALSDNAHGERSTVLRAMGIGARSVSTMDESMRFGHEAMAEARKAGDAELAAEAAITLAGSLAMAGDLNEALDLLDRAADGAPGSVMARLQFQRASILSLRGEVDAAEAAFSAALPEFRQQGDEIFEASTLHNRGLLRLLAGDLSGADGDLRQARALHVKNGTDLRLAGAEHNLALLAAYQGDVPEALNRLNASEEIHLAETRSVIPVHSTRCEILISVGLFHEALSLATEIADRNHALGLDQDEGEARFLAAQAALLAGETQLAVEHADRAAGLFASQGRKDWLVNAHRLEVQARYEGGSVDGATLEAAIRVAEELADGSLQVAALNAQLVAGLIALELGDLNQATKLLEPFSRLESGPVELRLQSRVASARLRLARGDRRGADAAARSGFRTLHEYQALLGASDIRAGLERHAGELGSIGLSLAVDSRTPRRVFRWMERLHSPILAFRPALPPDDQEQAADLAQLRKVASDLRTNDGSSTVELVQRQRRIQESIRRRSRSARGTESAPGLGKISPADTAEMLGNRELIEFAELDGHVLAVHISKGRFYMSEIGRSEDLARELEHLRFSMRRLARGGSRGTLNTELERFDHALFGEKSIRDEPIVIVPTGFLFATPWSALPSLGGRPITVAPSSGLWAGSSAERRQSRQVVVAGGPDLEHSDEEVEAVAGIYQNATRWTSSEATVEAVRTSLDGSRVAHIASHAFFEIDNPMFSSLRLADGDLYVYDVERMSSPPSLVVLSACDSGFTETHPGDELLGITAALLTMGSDSVVASVGLVPDSVATKELMVEFHHGFADGLAPAHSLAAAQASVSGTDAGFIAASSFVCIGAG